MASRRQYQAVRTSHGSMSPQVVSAFLFSGAFGVRVTIRSTPGTGKCSTLPSGQCTSMSSTLVACPKAKVQPRIVGRQIASAADHISALLHAVRRHVHRRAHGIARALRGRPQASVRASDSCPAITLRSSTGWPSITLITASSLPSLNRSPTAMPRPAITIGQPRAFDRGNVLKLLALQVVKEHRPLRPAGAPLVLVDLRIDVAVGHQQVLPAVVVVVEECVAPAQETEPKSRRAQRGS